MLISLLMSSPSCLHSVKPSCHAVSFLQYPPLLPIHSSGLCVCGGGWGVGGDSVQRILLRVRPKIVRQHGAAAPPGPSLSSSHSSFFFSWHLNFIQYQLLLPPDLFSPCVSLFLSLKVTHCAEETPCDSPSTGSRGQGHSVPGFQS